MHSELATSWAAARGAGEHVHLDSAACSRTSVAVRRAVSDHLDLEASLGGYVAEAQQAPTLTRLVGSLGALTGFTADEVSLNHSAGDSMAQLLLALKPPSAGLLRSDYQRTVGTLDHLGTRRSWLPVDDRSRIDLDALPAWLGAEAPHTVIICAVSSHLGIAQPVLEATRLCREAGAVVIVDAAQALGMIDLADLHCDALVGTSRKWLAGPRGVGLLCVRSGLELEIVPPWMRPEEWPGLTPAIARTPPEATVASRIGLAVAVEELTAAGPDTVRERLRWLAARGREVLDGAAGWAVLEPVDEPTSITTLTPPAGVDVAQTRQRLLEQHRIATTALLPLRALNDVGLPRLRVSPHVDGTVEQLEQLARAL